MNTTSRKIGAALAGALMTFAMLAARPARVAAKSLLEMQIEEMGKFRVAASVEGNESEALVLTYVGTSTEAVVTISTQDITAYAPAGTADSSNFGTSGGIYRFDAAATDTMGELCDTIDALANYKCQLLGGISSDTLHNAANNVNFSLRTQTAASGTCDLKASGGCRIKGSSRQSGLTSTQVFDLRVGARPKTGGRLRLKTCTSNASGTSGFLRVFGKLRVHDGATDGVSRGDKTKVWERAATDDTDLQVPLDITEDGWLDFAKDAHVVVSAGNNGTTVQVAANFIECQWDEILGGQ